MSEFNKPIKSNRLLQSKRYTIAEIDAAEAYTSVFDLNTSEIFTQQSLILSDNIPYSGSSQDGSFLNSGSSNVPISKFYYRFPLTPSAVKVEGNTRNNVFFFLSGSGFTPGISTTADPQIIQPQQQTSFISNKYADTSLTTNNSENGVNDGGTAYNVVVSNQPNGPGGVYPTTEYQFDYKTGILQFQENATSPTTSTQIYITVYQYLGKTLDGFIANQEASGSGTGAGFPFSGSAEITGSLLISGSGGLIVSGSSNFSGSINTTSITGTNASFDSASIDVLIVDTIISSSTIQTTGSNTFGDGMEDVQTLVGTTKITGSAQITGSLDISGSLSIPGISNVSASIASAVAGTGIFNQVGATDVYKTKEQLLISSSAPLMSSPYSGSNPTVTNDGSDGTAEKYSVVSSQSGWFYNHNVGVPKSKAWNDDLEGSFFNRFNHNTDTSEILRYIAGLLSSSLPGAADASPNQRVFSGLTPTSTSTGTFSISGLIPQSSTNNTVTYSISKGFSSDGGTMFDNVSGTIYGKEEYVRTFSSLTSGNTSNSSNPSDTQLFALGDINTLVKVSGSLNFVYHEDSTLASNITSASGQIVSATGAPGANDITIGDLPVPNPAVPVTFQDGKFSTLFRAPLKFNDAALQVRFTNPTASMGYYEITSSVAIENTVNGAATTSSAQENKTRVFFANEDMGSTISNNTVNITGISSGSIGTPTSRSLSGAPYLLTNAFQIFSSASGVFNPLFSNQATLASITTNTGGTEGVSNPLDAGGMSKDLSMSGGKINTAEDVVFDSSFSTPRANNTIPFETDTIGLSGSVTFAAASGKTNLSAGTISPSSFTLNHKYMRRNNTFESVDSTFNYFDAGTYGQSAGITLAYFGRSQGFDSNSTNAGFPQTELLTGERWRKEINDNLLTSTLAGADDFTNYNTYTINNLGAKDLQQVPVRGASNGELIVPGGNKKYFLDTIAGDGYKYYARVYNFNVGTQYGFLNIDLGIPSSNNELVEWSDVSTSDSIACAVLFESTYTTALSARSFSNTNTMLFDAYPGSGNLGDTATTAGLNPFTPTLNIKSNNQPTNGFTSGLSGLSNMKFPLISAQGPLITNSPTRYDQVTILVRYKGDPTTSVTKIKVEPTAS